MGLDERASEGRFSRRQDKNKQIAAGMPGEDEDQLPPPVETIRAEGKEVGRNDPCPCNSGKKYKKCCGKPS